MPNVKTKTALLFHHAKYPSITIPAGKKAEVPEWVVRTDTFGAHAKAGNITVDEPPAAPPAPRAPKTGQRLKPAPPPEE